MDRVSDVRRAELLSATRLLQTQDAISRAEFDRMELERALDQIETEQVVTLIEGLAITEADIAELEARISGLEKQLVMLSGSTEEPAKNASLLVLIHRQTDAKTESHVASLDEVVMPGDIVEALFVQDDARKLVAPTHQAQRPGQASEKP